MQRQGIGMMVLALAAPLFALGCEDDGPGGPKRPANLADYFAAQPYANASCNQADTRLAGRREIRLFVTKGEDIVPYSQALQRYYRRHGLEFFATRHVIEVDQPFAINTNEMEIGTAAAREFPGVNLNDPDIMTKDPELYARVLRFVANFMFRPVIGFAEKYGREGTTFTNLAIIPEIFRAEGSVMTGPEGAKAAGLAVSPALIDVFSKSGTPEGLVWRDIALPAGFTPMMFLDGPFLKRFLSVKPDIADLIVSHEFGHTGALIHREVKHNLMYPVANASVNTCADKLDDDQITLMSATLGVGTRSRVIGRSDALAALDGHAHGAEPNLGARPRSFAEAFPPQDFVAFLRGDAGARGKLFALFKP